MYKPPDMWAESQPRGHAFIIDINQWWRRSAADILTSTVEWPSSQLNYTLVPLARTEVPWDQLIPFAPTTEETDEDNNSDHETNSTDKSRDSRRTSDSDDSASSTSSTEL